MQYGQIINSYNPVKDNIYRAFVEYFNNPELTKIKDLNGFSMYGIKSPSLLGTEKRYLFVFVRQNADIFGTTKKLENLPWETLETITISDDYKELSCLSYIPRRLPYLNKKIELKYRDDKQYRYETEELPLIVTLLPSGKIKGLEYNINGNLISAIETYNTIITWKN